MCQQQQQKQAKKQKQKQAGSETLSTALLLACALMIAMQRLLLPWPGGFLAMPGAATRGLPMLRMLWDVLQLQAPAASTAEMRACDKYTRGASMPEINATIAAKAYAAKCGVLSLCEHLMTFGPEGGYGQPKVGSDPGELQLVVLQAKLLLAGSAWHLRSLMRESRGLSELQAPRENDTRGRRVLDRQQLQRVPVEPAHEHTLQQLGVVLPMDNPGLPPVRMDVTNWLVAAINLVEALTTPQPASAEQSPAAAFFSRSCFQGGSAATYTDVETLSLEMPPLMLQCVLLLPEAYAPLAANGAAAVVKPLTVQAAVWPALLGAVTHTTPAAAMGAFLARRQQTALQMLRALLCHILPAISAVKRRKTELVQPSLYDKLEVCLAALPGMLFVAAAGAC